MLIDNKIKYYKITNNNEYHKGYQYVDGINILDKPFQKDGSCVPGGLYFTTSKYILRYISYGNNLREVQLCNDSEVVIDPSGDKLRADKIFLGKKYDLSQVDTIKMLIDDDPEPDYIGVRKTIYWAILNENLDVINYLCKIKHFTFYPILLELMEIVVNGKTGILLKSCPFIDQSEEYQLLCAINDHNLPLVKEISNRDHYICPNNNFCCNKYIYFTCVKGYDDILLYLLELLGKQNIQKIIGKYYTIESIKKMKNKALEEKYSMYDFVKKYNIIHAACKSDNLKIIYYLRNYGFTFDLYDEFSYKILIKNGNIKIIKFFHNKGGDLVKFGHLMLRYAIHEKNIDILKMIIEETTNKIHLQEILDTHIKLLIVLKKYGNLDHELKNIDLMISKLNRRKQQLDEMDFN